MSIEKRRLNENLCKNFQAPFLGRKIDFVLVASTS